MVASSSNLLLVASSTHAGHVRTGSTIPNDHDLTMTNFSTENSRGYMIRSTSTNNISGISGTNLKDMIMLETVAASAYASTPSATSAATTPPSATKSEEKPRPSPRPRRKKMVSTGVDAMKKMIVTSCSVVVALPESPPPTVMVSRKHEREQRDDIDSVFNIRSTATRKVLAFDMSAPSMPDMMMMMPALPTPALNRNSKLTNEMRNNATPMKKQKKKNHLHMGRRLRQIKKRLTSSKSGSKSFSKQVEEVVCLSKGTSATTSTSSFAPTSSQEEEDDLPFMDTMDMMLMNMTTTLKPRVRSMFSEELEDMMMMPMMPVLPAPPCPLSSSTEDVVTTTPTPSASFSSKLDKALSVFSPSDGDDDDGDAVADDDTADEWGVFTSDDNDEEEDHQDDIVEPKYNNFKSKASSRSSFTKHTINPCFQPRAHLPVFAATAGAE